MSTVREILAAHQIDDEMHECSCGRWESWGPIYVDRYEHYLDHVSAQLIPRRSHLGAILGIIAIGIIAIVLGGPS